MRLGRLEHCLLMCRLGGPVIAMLSLLSIGGCRDEQVASQSAVLTAKSAGADHGLEWTEKQALTIRENGSAFGSAVAMAGDLLVVGAPDQSSATPVGSPGSYGAVYVFRASGDRFELEQALLAPPSDAWNAFGWSLSIANESLFVSAKGQRTTTVFARENESWIERQVLAASDGTPLGGPVAALDDTAVVTAPNTYAAYVFERGSDRWVESTILEPESEGDDSPPLEFGSSAAIATDTIVIGAPSAFVGGSSPGAAFAFQRDSNGDWQQQRLVAPDGVSNDRFGDVVAIAGARIFIGAPQAISDPTLTPGAVYVFERIGSRFEWRQTLMRGTTTRADVFGSALAASENWLLVSVPSAGAGPSGTQGVVEAYARGPARWERTQTFSAASDDLFDGFGVATAIDGTRAVVGAPYRRAGRDLTHGAVYVEQLLASDGQACTAADDCRSGHCASGVCCDRECGPCGTCDTGVCATRAPGSDGEPSCQPYVCDGSSVVCLDACRTSADCAASYYCDAGACVERRPDGAACRTAAQCLSRQCIDRHCLGQRALGEPCSGSAQCGSGFCVDQRCCDRACDDQCEACDTGVAPGICSVVSGRPHGNRQACRGDGSDCSGACDGRDPAACVYPTASTACGSYCQNADMVQKSCDGDGECIASEPRPCDGNLACEGELACKRSCSSNADCRARFTCDVTTGECVPRAVCADQLTSLGADGSKADCSPYICDEGSCKTRCNTKDDCASPLVCDGERCVAGPAVPRRTPGCSLGPPTRDACAPAGLLLLASWVARRRSRSRAPGRRGPIPRSAGRRLKAKLGSTAILVCLMVRASPLMAEELRWVEKQQLGRAVRVAGDRFGAAVALSKGTLAVGVPFATGGPVPTRGSVDIFVEQGGKFALQATLSTDDADADESFGSSVAISGDTVLVGAPGPWETPGAAYVFERKGVSWNQTKKLVPPDSQATNFGRVLALDGDTAVVGQSAGWLTPVFVFSRREGEWLDESQALVDDSDDGRDFGVSVAISGDTIAVGAPMGNESSGAVFVFTRSGDSWTPQQVLKPSVNHPDQRTGSAVAIQGDLIVAGAPLGWGRVDQYSAGTAFLFERSGGVWTESALLGASNGSGYVHFGLSTAVSGRAVVVGTERGFAYAYAERGSSWDETEQELRPSDGAQLFGSSIAMDGDVAAVATPGRATVEMPGAVYIERLRIPNGGTCEDAGSCQNGFCVAGVCCDSDCGACGTCDTGACKLFPRGGYGRGCEPYLCDGASSDCATSCSSDEDCAPQHYCRTGACVEQLPAGAKCRDASECASGNCGESRRCLGNGDLGLACRTDFDCVGGYCVDGVCCDGACAGQCEACDVPGSLGQCTGVSGAPRGDRTPCGGDGGVCGGSCAPSERRACSYPTATTECGSTCIQARETPLACDGLGHCAAGRERSCNNLRCADETRCKARCESDGDCVPGFACQADGSCGPAAYCIGNTSIAADGTSQSCGRYACDTTQMCKTACTMKSDCVEPYVCAGGGRCVEPPGAHADDDAGCSCRLGSSLTRTPSEFGWLASLLAALALKRRRFERRRASGGRTGSKRWAARAAAGVTSVLAISVLRR